MYLWHIIFRTAILLGPQSVIATFGETVTFHCSGRGNNIIWLIDGTNVTLMSPEMINLRGIEVATIKNYYSYYSSNVHYTYQSSINMTANCINNYTTVQCSVSTCWYQVTSGGSLQVEGTVIILLVLASIFILLDDVIFQPPNITAIGQNSVLLHLDSSNASYNVIIVDMSNGSSIVTNENLFGNSNAYKLELENPDPCHLYNVSVEFDYYETCISGIVYLLATFEASEFEQFAFIIMNLYISQSHLRSTKRQ